MTKILKLGKRVVCLTMVMLLMIACLPLSAFAATPNIVIVNSSVNGSGKGSNVIITKDEPEEPKAQADDDAVDYVDVALDEAETGGVVLPDDVTAESFGDNTVTDGTTYYKTMVDALLGIHLTQNRVLYCKPGADVGSMTHGHVCDTLTVYGNGAKISGGEQDFEIGQYNYCHNGANVCGGITADLTLTVKYLNGAGAWGTRYTNPTVTIVFENCKDMSRIYMNGTAGANNITVKDSTFTGNAGGDCKVYSNANGIIKLQKVEFSNINVPVNLNHKVAGTQIVEIEACSFTNCGYADYDYAAPVRVLSSVEGANSVLTISKTTFSGTVANKQGQSADILLDYGVGLTQARISDTAANVAVEKANNTASVTEIANDEEVSFANKALASVNGTEYDSLVEALEAAQAGNEIIILVDVTEDITVPAGVIFNGNGKQVGVITAAGEITFKGHTKATNFGAQYTNTTINIIEGACLEITGTGRLVIGHGCTFNITGTIADAKTANVADLTPSLIAAGASFTGAGVNFNVTNAYIKFTAYCSSKNSNANGTFNINVTNSIWEQTGSLVFSEPISGMDPTFNFTVKNSVLNSTSHLVFAVTKGEIVIDNSDVNVGKSHQIENQSTMIVKNGSVVNGAVATSSNAKNPGTLIIDNATYAVTGEFSGSDLGTGTLIVKNGASFTAGSITKADIQIDATGMNAGDTVQITANLSKLAGTLEVINNDELYAKIVDGKIVLDTCPVMIGGKYYASLQAAINAVKEGETIVLLRDVTENVTIADDSEFVLDLGGYTLNGYIAPFKGILTIKNGSIVNTNVAYGAIAINEGELTLENVNVTSAGDIVRIDGTVWATIDGGNFSGSFSVSGDGALEIYGGIFDQDPTKYVGYGLVAVEEDGIYRVKAAVEAKIGNRSFATLADAIKAAKSGEIILLQADVDIDTVIEITKNITIADYGTYTITFAEGTGIVLKDNASLILEKILFVGGISDVTAYNATPNYFIVVDGTNASVTLTEVNTNSAIYVSADADGSTIDADGKKVVLAAGAEGIKIANAEIEGAVAKIGDVYYTSFAAAVLAATTEEIVLLQNVSVSGQNALDKLTGKTLNLNDKTLTVSGNSYFSNGTTTFKNGNVVVTGYASDAFFCGYTAGAVIVFDDVAISGNAYSTGCAVFNANLGKVEVKNSTVTLSGDTSGGVFYGGAVSVDNSEITATNVCRGFTNSVATIQNGSEFVFDGGETGLNNSTVTVNGSTVEIKNATKRAVRLHNNTLTVTNGSTLTVTECAEDVVYYNPTSEAQVVKSNDSTITAEIPSLEKVASIGTKRYFTLADAFAAAQAGDTITIFAGEYDYSLVVDKSITVIGEGDVTLNGVPSIKGNGYKVVNIDFVYATGSGNLSGSGVIENCTFTATAADGNTFRYCYGATNGEITFKGCTLNAPMWAIHFDSAPNMKFNLVDCDINGRVALAGDLGSLNAEGTTFENGYVNVWGTVSGATFEECNFVDVPYIFTGYDADNTFNFNDCTTTVKGDTKNVTDIIYGGNDSASAEIYVDGALKSGVAKISDTYYATLADAFDAAKNGDEVVILKAGKYALSTSGKNITITGEVDGVVFDNIGAHNMGGASVTFNNVTFNYAANSTYKGLQHSGDLVYNDCTINGQVFLYGTSETFNKCTFVNTGDNYNVWTYSAKKVTFDECTFNSAGKSVLIYHESATVFNEVAVTESTFNASATVEGKAAIEMDSSLTAGIKLTVDAATTAAGFGNGNVSGNSLWNNKKGNNTDANNDITVVVGTETVLAPVTFVAKIGEIGYTDLHEALTACKNGETVNLLADVDLNNVEWEPVEFKGTFDGNNHKISNLVVNKPGVSNVGFFSKTEGAEIRNVIFENAKVTGRLNVGVVAGHPWTTKYTNITVTGHVEVNGMAYVGGVGGKNAYADWTDIKVDVDSSSYVSANSVENGVAYRTYVGGVIGFIGEGSHTFTNISSNIKVIGSTCDIGGLFGIAHYGTNFDGVTFTGSVEAPADAEEVGGIAGVWHNAVGNTVIFNNVTSTGTVTVGTETTTGSVVGGAYNPENEEPGNSGSLKIDGKEAWIKVAQVGNNKYLTLEEAAAAAQAGDTIKLLDNVTLSATLTLPAGITLDGNGKTISGTIQAGGDLTFVGNTTVSGFSAGWYNNTITIGEGASLKVTNNRVTVSYGNIFNITGSITDAKNADKSTLTPSLEFTAGISFTGNGGDVKFNVTNAYVVLGDSSTKNSAATGKFNLNFTNSIVDFTKTLKTNTPTASGLAPEFNLIAKDSVISFASHLELWLDGTTVALDNTDLTVDGSFANAGTVTLNNNSNFVVKAPIMSSHGGNTGTIEVLGGTFELKDSNQDWENAGTIKITKGGKLITNDFKCVGDGKIAIDAKDITEYTVLVDGNGAYDFSGVTTVDNLVKMVVSYKNGDVTLLEAVAQIGSGNTAKYYLTFKEALEDVQDGETITLLDVEGSESAEIDFTKEISFTITGNAPKYALPVITFQNATVTIKDAEILVPELDARQNATINVVNSIVHDAGGNSIAKSYYNGAINIVDSKVYMMQLTTMGYVTISGDSVVNITWQTNVYGNGMITVTEGATLNTAALHLTGKDYSGRDNTDPDRVGKPATIIVDGATFTVGKVKSDNGADYSYNSGKGINIGTIESKAAVLDIKNGANVNIYMANGETANIGANGTVNVDGSTFNVVCRAENGTVTLANNGAFKVSGNTSLNINSLTGNRIEVVAGTKLKDSTIGGGITMLGDLTIDGALTLTGGLWASNGGTLSGGTLTAYYAMFQKSDYVINANMELDYGYLSYGATFVINSKIHTVGASGEVLYIRGDVTLNDGAILDCDKGIWLDDDAAKLTVNLGAKVDGNITITKSSATITIDATGMSAGEYANITGTVTKTTNFDSKIDVINGKLGLYVVIENDKIVLKSHAFLVNGESFDGTLAGAIAAAQPGDVIVLTDNIEIDGTLVINQGITLDLNGYTLEAEYFVAFKGNVITGEGSLKVAKDNAVFATNQTVENMGSAYMPVYMNGAYVFKSVSMKAQINRENGLQIVYVPVFDTAWEKELAEALGNSGLQFVVRISWDNGNRCQDFIFSDSLAYDVYKNGKAFSLRVGALADVEDLNVEIILRSDTGFEVSATVKETN